jgi:hypothetical protein
VCPLGFAPLSSNQENVALSLQIVEFVFTIIGLEMSLGSLCHEEDIDL